MKFRLNFRVSGETTLNLKVVIKNIETQLDNKGYEFIHVTKSAVEFKTNPWALRWNFEPMQLDGGTFIITSSDSGTAISLH